MNIRERAEEFLAVYKCGKSPKIIRDLLAELKDWQDSQTEIMQEECPDDGLSHCTCVPILKKMVKELKAECERLEKELKESQALFAKLWCEGDVAVAIRQTAEEIINYKDELELAFDTDLSAGTTLNDLVLKGAVQGVKAYREAIRAKYQRQEVKE